MNADLINALFEVMGCFFILGHCSTLLKDRKVAGVNIYSSAGMTAWGFWNIYYYPSLDQWASLVGGIGIVMANALYVVLLLKNRNN